MKTVICPYFNKSQFGIHIKKKTKKILAVISSAANLHKRHEHVFGLFPVPLVSNMCDRAVLSLQQELSSYRANHSVLLSVSLWYGNSPWLTAIMTSLLGVIKCIALLPGLAKPQRATHWPLLDCLEAPTVSLGLHINTLHFNVPLEHLFLYLFSVYPHVTSVFQIMGCTSGTYIQNKWCK